MRRISYKHISHIKPLLYTTLMIILFMVSIPLLSIKTKNEFNLSKGINNENEIAEASVQVSNEVYIDGKENIKVYRTLQNKVEEVDIEDYVCGVVANEMQVSFDDEALKAQAIASRTYLANKMLNNCKIADGADICDSTNCQVYSSKEELISKWGEESGDRYWNKINTAVNETKGMVLMYNGELALYPLFFSTSSGRTESASDASFGDIPYLKSVESSGEEVAPKFTSTKEMALGELVLYINSKYPNSGVTISNLNSKLNVLERSKAGGVISLAVGNEKISGSDFRVMAGLNSTNFTYSISENTIVFDCRGYGHGVGMSQWGANIMAKEGKTYDEILKHYYTGINIGNLKFN